MFSPLRSEDGQTAVEYAAVLALAVAMVLVLATVDAQVASFLDGLLHDIASAA